MYYIHQEAAAAVDTAETGWFSWASEINVTSVLEQATAAVSEGASAAAASAYEVCRELYTKKRTHFRVDQLL